MKMLLDESLPRRLKTRFPDIDVHTVPEMGWSGTTNGKLLRLACDHFDVFLTADQNLQYQQNIVGYDIAVVVLVATSNRLPDLEPLVPAVREILPKAQAGEVIRLGNPNPPQ